MNVTFEIDIQHIEFTKNYFMHMNKKRLIGQGQHLCDFFASNQVQSIINTTSWRTPNVNSIIINIPMKMTQIESTPNYFPS
jgi:ABC-type thiamine transport system substrate-binding protein